MPSHTRIHSLQLGNYTNDELLLESMRYTERFGEPFQAVINVVSEEHELNTEQMLGKPIKIKVEPQKGRKRFFHGLVFESRYMGTSDSISQLPPGGDNYVDAEQRRLASAEQLGKATASGSAGENRLSSMESAEQLDRLQYLCQLLQVHRHPACPINGLLVVVTKRFASESDAQLHERENAMASDLRLVQQSTQLRCPVTVLVTGMEQEAGFRELIRRVGIKRARQQRFGKRYEATMAKNDSVLSAFAVHVCGAFEDWIYALFREQDALSRPGNVGLYQLLCNVRCSMKPRLTRLLTHVFSETPATEPLLFSGCYFAATGDTTDKQGFVRAVFNKLIQEQDLLEWTQQAKKQDVRMRWIGLLGLGVLVGVAVGLIAMVGLQFVNPG